ncbi:hypothetical protein HK102_006164, partial [Quaeritorhiza haematococci]
MAPTTTAALGQIVLRTATHPLTSLLKNVLLFLFLYRNFSFVVREVWAKGPIDASSQLAKYLVKIFFKYARASIPGMNAVVQKEVDKHIKAVQDKLAPSIPGEKKNLTLPENGLSTDQVRSELVRLQKMGHVDWRGGKVSGAIYHGQDDLTSLLTEAYGMFALTNPLHPEIFPGVRKMESEVVAMTLSMYNAPDGAVGNVTSGGTESLLMAIKAYRDMARDTRGVTEPEMVAPVTIHAAFDKAASYFGIKLVHIPIETTTGKVDLAKVARAINKNTIMIAGSAPNFPHGIIDNLPALSNLALQHSLPLHIDACLGGFLLPFMERA